MARKPYIDNERKKKRFVEVYNDLIKYPNLYSVALELDISLSSIRRNIIKLKNEGIILVERTEQSENEQIKIANKFTQETISLRNQIGTLKKQLTEAQRESLSSTKLMDLIHGVGNVKYETNPEWISWKNPKKGKHENSGIPFLFLSDLHFDEVVNPAQIEYMNSFNRDIAVKRIKHVFHTALDLLLHKMATPKYDGIICALGGDMVSGIIHEELAETNENSILHTIIDLSDLLINGIGTLADAFGKVFVPCVVGNHGRIHKKPRYKNKAQDNYEWLIYHQIAKYFANDSRVTVNISESPDLTFSVYNKRFLLTHGDQFSGGSGISGIFTPIMLGVSRKQRRNASLQRNFDCAVMGHFHQLIMTDQLIVNSSLKGYDEFAYNHNFPYEPPQQALWLNHPDYGITIRMPILCDMPEANKKSK